MDGDPTPRLAWYVVFPWEYVAAVVIAFVVITGLGSDAGSVLAGTAGAMTVGTFQQRRARERRLRTAGERSDRTAVVGPRWLDIALAVMTVFALSGVGVGVGGVFRFDGRPPRTDGLLIGAVLFGIAVVLYAVLFVTGRRRRRRRRERAREGLPDPRV